MVEWEAKFVKVPSLELTLSEIEALKTKLAQVEEERDVFSRHNFRCFVMIDSLVIMFLCFFLKFL